MTCRDFGMKQIKLVDVRKLDAFLELIEEILYCGPVCQEELDEISLRFYEARRIVQGLLK